MLWTVLISLVLALFIGKTVLAWVWLYKQFPRDDNHLVD